MQQNISQSYHELRKICICYFLQNGTQTIFLPFRFLVHSILLKTKLNSYIVILHAKFKNFFYETCRFYWLIHLRFNKKKTPWNLPVKKPVCESSDKNEAQWILKSTLVSPKIHFRSKGTPALCLRFFALKCRTAWSLNGKNLMQRDPPRCSARCDARRWLAMVIRQRCGKWLNCCSAWYIIISPAANNAWVDARSLTSSTATPSFLHYIWHLFSPSLLTPHTGTCAARRRPHVCHCGVNQLNQIVTCQSKK